MVLIPTTTYTEALSTRNKMSGYAGGLNWSAQHMREVYSLDSRNLRSFAGVGLDAARACPVGIACSRRGPFFSAGIVAASDLCFRWFLAAKGCADHRSRLSHSWPP